MKKCAVFLFIFAVLGVIRADSVTNIPFNRVIRTTPVNTNLVGAAIGDGLTLSNGVLIATGGGGGAAVDMEAVTNAARAVVAVATNAFVPKSGGAFSGNVFIGDDEQFVRALVDGTCELRVGGTDYFSSLFFDGISQKYGDETYFYSFPLQSGTIAIEPWVTADFVAKTKKELHADSVTNICWQTCYSNGWVYLLPYSNNTGDAE